MEEQDQSEPIDGDTPVANAGGLFTSMTSGVSRSLTREMLEEAFKDLEERYELQTQARIQRWNALDSLNLNLELATNSELTLIHLAYEGHILHPSDYDRLQTAITRLRRDF